MVSGRVICEQFLELRVLVKLFLCTCGIKEKADVVVLLTLG